jgi:hypothetical protein
MLIFLTGCTFASYIISKVKLSYSGTVDLSRICIESDHQNTRECTGCIKKNATSEFPKKSTLFERQKILGAWEFKIAQLPNYCTRECIKQNLCIYLMHNNSNMIY